MRILFCYMIPFLVLTEGQIHGKCRKLSSCVCQDESGQVVDLRPLGRKDGIPMYNDNLPTNNGLTSFSFNPCFAFDKGTKRKSSCSKVAVCMRINDTDNFIDIGTQESAKFGFFDTGSLSLEYRSKDNSHRTTVRLYCAEDEDNMLRAVGCTGDNHCLLQLQSKHCCPKTPTTSDTYLRFKHAQTTFPATNMILKQNTNVSKEPCLICAKSLHLILFVILALSLFTLAIMIFVYVVKRQRLHGHFKYLRAVTSDDSVHFDATEGVIT